MNVLMSNISFSVRAKRFIVARFGFRGGCTVNPFFSKQFHLLEFFQLLVQWKIMQSLLKIIYCYQPLHLRSREAEWNFTEKQLSNEDLIIEEEWELCLFPRIREECNSNAAIRNKSDYRPTTSNFLSDWTICTLI